MSPLELLTRTSGVVARAGWVCEPSRCGVLRDCDEWYCSDISLLFLIYAQYCVPCAAGLNAWNEDKASVQSDKRYRRNVAISGMTQRPGVKWCDTETPHPEAGSLRISTGRPTGDGPRPTAENDMNWTAFPTFHQPRTAHLQLTRRLSGELHLSSGAVSC